MCTWIRLIGKAPSAELDSFDYKRTGGNLNSKSCTRKHVPEKKIKKHKERVIPTDYRGFN